MKGAANAYAALLVAGGPAVGHHQHIMHAAENRTARSLIQNKLHKIQIRPTLDATRVIFFGVSLDRLTFVWRDNTAIVITQSHIRQAG